MRASSPLGRGPEPPTGAGGESQSYLPDHSHFKEQRKFWVVDLHLKGQREDLPESFFKVATLKGGLGGHPGKLSWEFRAFWKGCKRDGGHPGGVA